ncbi:MAG: HAD-IIA family hydrolase [Chloroflexi bacterium]|nr:HAD-IIA family hydrolase [Chloroflexota bacterium]
MPSSSTPPTAAKRSLAEYGAYLFDIDGTLVTPNGAIDGAAEVIETLKRNGKQVRAVTNNSGLTPHAVAERFRRFGLPFDDSEVFSALTATARFVAHERPGARVFPFGTSGMRSELAAAGLTVTDDLEVDYVVAGFYPEITFETMTRAMRALMQGARFVAVNVDRNYIGHDGLMPGAGAFVRALEGCTGRAPDVIVGKPSITIVQEAVASVRLSAEDCLFVGDNLDADIGAAHAAGLPALLVLSGVTSRAELEARGIAVEHVSESVVDLARAFG